MTRTDRLIAELAREAGTTRRVLERVPEGRLSWKPHPKSMSLGQLAWHIAAMPGGLAEIISRPVWENQPVPRPEAPTLGEVLTALDHSVATLTTKLQEWGDEGLHAEWKLVQGDRTLLASRRGDVIRFIILNHWYHHRGQLTVYLRLLDVPLPPVYGETADEKPFG